MARQAIYQTSLLGDSNLQGYWKAESNVNDSGPNGYNLTASGSPTYVTGAFGTGINLVRASSQYANITEAAAPNLDITSDLTCYAWIKGATFPGVNSVLAKFSNANTGYILYVDSAAKLNFTCSGLNTNTTVIHTTVMSTGVWYQVVGTYNSTTQKLSAYVNGVEVQVTASGSTTNNAVFFGLGASAQGAGDTAANYFDGGIDEAAVFNRALTATEIASLYDGSHTKRSTVGEFNKNSTGLVGLWHLNGNSIDDSTNSNNGTDTAITYVSGRFGEAASYNGSTSEISINNGTQLNFGTGSFSVSFWVRPTNIGAGNQDWIARPGATQAYFLIRCTSTGDLLVQLNKDGSNNLNWVHGLVVFTNNTWTHVTSVIDRTAGKGYNYINGTKLVSEGTVVGNPSLDTVNSWVLGENAFSGIYPVGQLDEVALFNIALTAKQAKEHYAWSIGRRSAIL